MRKSLLMPLVAAIGIAGCPAPGPELPDATDVQNVGDSQDVRDVQDVRDAQDVVDSGARDASDVQDAGSMDVADSGDSGGPPPVDVPDVGVPDAGDSGRADASDGGGGGTCSPACPAGETCMGTMCRSSVCSLTTQPGGIVLPAVGMSTSVMGSVGTTGMISTFGCTTSGGAAGEQIWTMVVPTTMGIELETASNFDTVLGIRSADCTAVTSEVACDDDGSASGSNSLIRTVLGPGTYSVVVDGYSASSMGMYTLNVRTFMAAGNAACSSPEPIPSTMQNSMSGATPSSACSTFDNGGQLFYSYNIAPRTRVTFTATPAASTTPATRARVRVLDSCNATTCLSTGVSATDNAPGTATFDNLGTTSRNVIVSVSTWDSTENMTFDIAAMETALPPAPTNAACGTATTVMNGTMLTNIDSTIGTDLLPTAGASLCGSATGPVLFYAVDVPANNILRATATPTSAFNTSIRLIDACASPLTMCLQNADQGGAGAADTLAFTNNGPARRMILAVGGRDATTGTFNLSVSVSAPTGNEVCGAATALTNGVTLSAQDPTRGVDSLASRTNCGTNTAGVVYYTAVVPDQQYARFTVTPSSSTWNPVVRVLPTCAATTCAAQSDGASAGQPETIVYPNTSGSDQQVIVAVGGTTPTGTFTIRQDNAAVPANANCAQATMVSDGTVLSNELIGLGADTLPAMCGVSTVTPPRANYYRALVPNGQTLTVSATPNNTSLDMVISVLGSCGASMCTATADSNFSGVGETLRYSNTSGSDQTVVFSVSPYSGNTSSSFTLRTTLSNSGNLPNAMCAAPTALTANGPALVAQDSTRGADNLSGGVCGTAGGNSIYYTASVPAGQIGFVTVTSQSGYNAVVRTLDGCGTICSGRVDATLSNGVETLRIDNSTGTTPRTQLIAVGATSTTTTGVFDIAFTTASVPANAVCATPRMVTAGTPIMGENPGLGAAALTGTGCGTTGGPVLYYQISIPAGNRALITATPTTSWNPVIYRPDSCTAGAACSLRRDAGLSGAAETATITNSTGSAQTVLFAVGSSSTSTVGQFNLTATVSPIPYLIGSIPGACDILGAPTTLMPTGTNDDSASVVTPLPTGFAFTLFGQAQQAFAMGTNGNVQFFPATTGTPATSGANADLPSTAFTAATLAPFWDDLVISSTMELKFERMTAPDRVVFEWTSANFYLESSPNLSNLRFQAKIFSGTNVIEFHYCTLTPAASGNVDRTTGNSATIGIQAANAADAITSFSSTTGTGMGPISTANAIRFTPN